MEGKLVAASVDDPQTIELQIVQGMPHRRREHGGVGAFDFEAKTLFTPDNEQVKLGAAVGAPKVALVRMSTKLPNCLLQRKPLP